MNYNIGDRIKDTKRDLTITDKRVLGEKYKTRSYYKYTCNVCGYDCGSAYRFGESIDELLVTNHQITKGDGCSCCKGITVSPKINSISKVRPDLVKYFTNKEDADKYTLHSNKMTNFTCPHCNKHSKNMIINTFVCNGFNCPKCSDKLSLGEKIMYLLLSDLEIEFIKEYSFEYSVLRYDFYIPKFSLIIEVHGRQHYEGSFQSYKGGKTLVEEQENDKIKYDFAIQNNIKQYIVVDARKSDYDYIQQSIISELSSIFDLSVIDWNKLKSDVFEKNIVKDICAYWESNPSITYEEMVRKFHFCRDTIRKYITIGKSLGWCSSSTSINNSHYNNRYEYDAPDSTTPIRCIDNNTYFKGSCLCSKVSESVFGL